MQIEQASLEELDDFQAWVKGAHPGPFTLLDYVGCVATKDLLFGFAELLAPTLVVHDGLHFVQDRFSADVFDDWVGQGTSRKETQRVMNHLHVSTLLQNQEVSDALAVEAARVIAAIWSRTLGPEGVVAESFGETFVDAAVTLYTRD